MRALLRHAFAILLGLAHLLPGAAAVEAPRQGDGVVEAGRVRVLVEQLGDESFQAREAALRALVAMGEGVWPLIRTYAADENEERAARVRQVGLQVAALDPNEKAQAVAYHAMLLDRDEFARARGLDGYLSLGSAGIRALREELSGRGAKPVLSFEVTARSGIVGETIQSEVQLTNEGTATCWLKRGSMNVSTSRRFQNGFAPPRSTYKRRLVMGGIGRRIACGGLDTGYYNPIRGYRGYAPQALILSSKSSHYLEQPGVYVIEAKGEVGGPSRIDPRLPGRLNTIDLEVGQGMNRRPQKFSQEVKVFSLPDVEDAQEDRGLRIRVAGREQAVVNGRPVLRVTPALSAVEGEAVHVEKNLARYAWYALVRENGTVASYGTWASVLRDGENDAALYGRLVECETDARWDLEMPLPEQADPYRLILGYEVGKKKYERIDFDTYDPDSGETVEHPALVRDISSVEDLSSSNPHHGVAYRQGALYLVIPDIVVALRP